MELDVESVLGGGVNGQEALGETFRSWEDEAILRAARSPTILGMKCSGALDASDSHAELVPVEDLRPSALPYLPASRYCETELLSKFAWAVCDYAHNPLKTDSV